MTLPEVISRATSSTTLTITKETVANQIAAYLRHERSLPDLVDWAEDAMMDGELAEEHATEIAPFLARLGVADVAGFGLSWDDCEEALASLGFAARVEVVAAYHLAIARQIQLRRRPLRARSIRRERPPRWKIGRAVALDRPFSQRVTS